MLREKVRKLQDSLLMLCIKAKSKAMELREDENAMEVIQVVILIAVGVVIIIAVWAAINGLLEKWWAIIIGQEPPETKFPT